MRGAFALPNYIYFTLHTIHPNGSYSSDTVKCITGAEPLFRLSTHESRSQEFPNRHEDRLITSHQLRDPSEKKAFIGSTRGD